jgi:alkylhydroperoxidase/carboxymuconolactone decarboxylase family protein YurZ
VHSQVRRGIAEGLSRDEHRHVAFLAMTILGLPKAVAALTWIEDIVEEGGKP